MPKTRDVFELAMCLSYHVAGSVLKCRKRTTVDVAPTLGSGQ